MPRSLGRPIGVAAVAAPLALTLNSVVFACPSTVTDAHKWGWSENIGWLNFRDANTTLQGARAVVPPGRQTPPTGSLRGFVWAENVGWINLGRGPASGNQYANDTGEDFGVNVLADASLAGFAWGENVGWINFSTSPSLEQYGQHARLDVAEDRFRGYAWAENVGWINLDDTVHYVVFNPADYNDDGVVDLNDYFEFLGGLFTFDPAVAPRADLNCDEVVDINDYFDFLGEFFARFTP